MTKIYVREIETARPWPVHILVDEDGERIENANWLDFRGVPKLIETDPPVLTQCMEITMPADRMFYQENQGEEIT